MLSVEVCHKVGVVHHTVHPVAFPGPSTGPPELFTVLLTLSPHLGLLPLLALLLHHALSPHLGLLPLLTLLLRRALLLLHPRGPGLNSLAPGLFTAIHLLCSGTAALFTVAADFTHHHLDRYFHVRQHPRTLR